MSKGRKNFAKAMEDTFGRKPTEVEGIYSSNTLYYQKQLHLLLKGRFELTCPADWDVDYVLDCLLDGHFVVTDSPLGILPFTASISGTNVFRRPTHVEITNPVLSQTITRTLGVDAVVVYLYNNLDFRGVFPLINKYAYQLANCDAAVDVNLMNSRVPFVFECADGKQANEAKKLYDKISRGEPAVFYRPVSSVLGEDNKMAFYPLPVRQNFMVPEIQDAKRTIMNEFLTTIGVNCNNVDKKERVNTIEATANNEEIETAAAYWKRNLKECCSKVRNMFGIEFDIKMKESEVQSYDVDRPVQGSSDTTR